MWEGNYVGRGMAEIRACCGQVVFRRVLWLLSLVIHFFFPLERGGGTPLYIFCPAFRWIGGGQRAFLVSASSQLPSAQNNFNGNVAYSATPQHYWWSLVEIVVQGSHKGKKGKWSEGLCVMRRMWGAPAKNSGCRWSDFYGICSMY